MSKINILMYHYVRKIRVSKFPKIKGLEFESFKKQLNFLQENFNIIDPKDLLKTKSFKLPDHSCVLTFDDGYKDHIKYVFPELKKRKLKGCFFPTGMTTFENKILDANMIQHILSKVISIDKLFQEINRLCLELGVSEKFIKDKILLDSKNPKNRYDLKKVIYIKRLLQFGLHKNIRQQIIKLLFKKYVNIPENIFSKNFYLNPDDINKLLDNEMTIGSHTFNHQWLGKLSRADQNVELDKSVEFLKYFKIPTSKWIMCYPYGSYNQDTLSLLKKKKFKVGFTTKAQVANLNQNNLLELPRKDTNDYPQ